MYVKFYIFQLVVNAITVIPLLVKYSGFHERVLVSTTLKDKIDSYIKLWGAAGNMGVKSLVSEKLGGWKH